MQSLNFLVSLKQVFESRTVLNKVRRRVSRIVHDKRAGAKTEQRFNHRFSLKVGGYVQCGLSVVCNVDVVTESKPFIEFADVVALGYVQELLEGFLWAVRSFKFRFVESVV